MIAHKGRRKRRKKDFARSIARELIPFVALLSRPARVKPISMTHVGRMASSVNGQHLKPTRSVCYSSPGNSVYCYAELAISSLAVAVTIASTVPTHSQAELTWVVGYVPGQYTCTYTYGQKYTDL